MPEKGARTTAHRATVTDARRRRVARELLELFLRRVKRVVERRGIFEDRFELSALNGVLCSETLTFFVTLNGRCLGHGRRKFSLGGGGLLLGRLGFDTPEGHSKKTEQIATFVIGLSRGDDGNIKTHGFLNIFQRDFRED